MFSLLSIARTVAITAAMFFTHTAARAVTVKATDPRIQYQGRFDLRDPNGPRCAWSASSVVIRFTGPNLTATINEDGADQYDVEVDHGKPTVLKLTKGSSTYTLAQGLSAGPHLVRLVKRTEPFVGVTQFRTFELADNGKLLTPPPPPAHRIEVIGDSISCGYGNEGKSQNEHFTNDTENANLTYGAITAKRFGAEYHCEAWSGRKMWPDNTIPEIYDLAIPGDGSSKYNLKAWVPDVILINLATNDFGQANPEREGWVKAYRDFLRHLRASAPKAMIFLATGPMMGDEWSGERKPLATLKSYLGEIIRDEAKAGDTRLRQIDFAVQRAEDGIGSDWHPSVKTHTLMADRWSEALRRELGWTAKSAP